jgi:hypothetical protein
MPHPEIYLPPETWMKQQQNFDRGGVDLVGKQIHSHYHAAVVQSLEVNLF